MNGCPTQNEMVGEMRDLVWAETGRALTDGDFSTTGAEPSVPAELLRPVIARGDGMDGTAITIREIPTMGKAAFVERPVTVDGVAYRFVQWKGVGANFANDRMAGAVSYPLGQRGMAPLFRMDAFGKRILRFKGGAFYEDLLHEARKSEEFASYRLRMPRILATIKFTRSFCERNGLPLPDNDDPNDAGGQTLGAFVESRRDEIDAEEYDAIQSADELSAGYASAILGENVRAFRNVWRVDDLERVMQEPGSPERTEKLATIVDASARIFSEEVGRDLSREEFLQEYVVMLGKQAAILIENRLNQGALLNIKQDVTLAAEICDFDNGYQLNDAYLNDEANAPNWVTDRVTRAEWEREQNVRVDRQILLLAAHIKPLADAIGELRGGPLDRSRIIDAFMGTVREGLSDPSRRDMARRIAETPDFGSVDAIAGTDALTKTNLDGCQEWFDRIIEIVASWT